MSASERLRALKVGDGLTPYELEEVLPEIVAVVEADDSLLRYLDALVAADHTNPWFTLRRLLREHHAAVAALEEKLSA